MPKNVVIIPASGWTYFNNSSSQTIGQLIVDPITEEFLISGNTLNLEGSTSVNVGNGYGNIYIGNGITPTNIIFDQSGEIKGDGSPLQLTFGSATDYIKISTNGQFDLIGIASASTTSNVLSYNSSTSRVNYTPLSLLFSSGASIGSFGNVLLNSVSGNTLIGTTTGAGFKLDVNGTTRLNGLQTFQGTTASDSPSLGSELAAVAGSGTNWVLVGTNLNVGGYQHTVGSVADLTTTLASVVSNFYQIIVTITGRTAGSIIITYGGFTSISITSSTVLGPRTTSTASLTITPTTDFDGTVSLSVRVISTSSATSTFNNSSGTTMLQIRSDSSVSNTFIGVNAGYRNLSNAGSPFGINNIFIGNYAGQSNTIGYNNTFLGYFTGANNTSGPYNTFLGGGAGQSNTTGNNNTFVGSAVAQSSTTGQNNTFLGTFVGAGLTGGSFNVFLGSNSGRYITGGSTILTTSDTSILIGYNVIAQGNSQSNQIVIGNGSTGLGSNTTVLGNTSTSFATIYGNVGLGTTTNSGYRLDVSGTARVTSGLTVSNSLILDGSDLATAWIPYVPTWESDGVTQPSLGNGQIRAFYKVIGKTVFLRVKLDWGTTTSGGSGVWLFGLPIDTVEPYGIQFACSILDNGNAWYQGIVNGEYSGFTDKVAIIAQSAGGVNSSQGVTATFPFTWGNLDSLQFSGSYEST